MATNRPRGREKNVTNNSKGVKKRGSGLGTGPVGNAGGYSGRPGRRPVRSSGGQSGGGLFKIIIF